MFKVLVVQAQHNLSDARMEFMIRDRLSWMRFFGFDLGSTKPDENTIRHYRNRLTERAARLRHWCKPLSSDRASEQQPRERGYLAMGGQIDDAARFPLPSSVTPRKRRPRSRRAKRQSRSGRASRPRHIRRMSMRAGRCRLVARSATVPMVRPCRRLQRRCLATSHISASTGGSSMKGTSPRNRCT